MPAFRYPRTSQPQGAVEIDRSNPLARGLVFAHIPTRSGAVINGSGLGRIAPDVGGIAAITDYSPGAGNQDITWPISTGVLASARTFVVLSANDGAVDGFDTNSVEGNGPDGFSFDRLAIGASSFFPTMDRNSGSGLSITSSAQPRIFAGRVIGGQQNVWHNGVSSSNSVTGTRRITPAQLRVGRNGSDTTVTTTCYLSLYWSRYLSDAELSLLSKAPWQLFKPQARSLWTPGTVSGGGAVNYTLSAVAGGYAVSGKAATLSYVAGASHYALTAAAGSYAISGNAATLTYAAGSASHAYTLTAASGVYALSGKPATLTYTSLSPINYTLTAAKGAYSVIGMDASFAFSGAQKGGGIPRKKFQIETAQGVIAVDSLAEASRIIARAKKSASKPVVTLQGIKVAAPTKKTLDYKAIEARMRAEIQAEIDDEEDLLMML